MSPSQLDTLIVTQPVADPDHLDVCRITNDPISCTPLTTFIEMRRGPAVTRVDVGAYGVCYADKTDRIYVHSTPSIMSPAKNVNPQRSVPQRQTYWAASPVTALTATESMVLCGCKDGRLLAFSYSNANTQSQPELLASSNSPWLELIPVDAGVSLAINADGTWVRLDGHGIICEQGKLPVYNGQVVEAQYCSEHQILLYIIASVDTHCGIASGNQWQAWSLADHQPLPLPAVIRFAPALIATTDAILVFNTQGGSWLGVPFRTGIEVQPLCDWPSGPVARFIPINESPAVLRLDLRGALRVFAMEENRWHPLDLPLHFKPVADVWAAGPGTWARAYADQQEQEAIQLAQKTLKAHLEHREAERDDLLVQLDQTRCGSIRANILRARIAHEEGRYLDIVEELTQSIIHAGGVLPNAMQRRLGKTLWRIGGLSQLSAFSPELWPSVYDTSTVPDGIDHYVFSSTAPYFVDAFAHTPSQDCSWSESAWAALKRWGSTGPYWIGTEHEPPIDLHNTDYRLLPEIMKACGGSSMPIHRLTPDGQYRECIAWIFSEPISPGIHRQLLIYHWPKALQNMREYCPEWLGVRKQLLLCWAIQTDRFLSPEMWRDAWEAVHDRVWRDAHDHRIEVIHQSLAHRIVPGNELLDLINPVAVDSQQEIAT